jgi:hypothetical protein
LRQDRPRAIIMIQLGDKKMERIGDEIGFIGKGDGGTIV